MDFFGTPQKKRKHFQPQQRRICCTDKKETSPEPHHWCQHWWRQCVPLCQRLSWEQDTCLCSKLYVSSDFDQSSFSPVKRIEARFDPSREGFLKTRNCIFKIGGTIASSERAAEISGQTVEVLLLKTKWKGSSQRSRCMIVTPGLRDFER